MCRADLEQRAQLPRRRRTQPRREGGGVHRGRRCDQEPCCRAAYQRFVPDRRAGRRAAAEGQERRGLREGAALRRDPGGRRLGVGDGGGQARGPRLPDQFVRGAQRRQRPEQRRRRRRLPHPDADRPDQAGRTGRRRGADPGRRGDQQPALPARDPARRELHAVPRRPEDQSDRRRQGHRRLRDGGLEAGQDARRLRGGDAAEGVRRPHRVVPVRLAVDGVARAGSRPHGVLVAVAALARRSAAAVVGAVARRRRGPGRPDQAPRLPAQGRDRRSRPVVRSVRDAHPRHRRAGGRAQRRRRGRLADDQQGVAAPGAGCLDQRRDDPGDQRDAARDQHAGRPDRDRVHRGQRRRGPGQGRGDPRQRRGRAAQSGDGRDPGVEPDGDARGRCDPGRVVPDQPAGAQRGGRGGSCRRGRQGLRGGRRGSAQPGAAQRHRRHRDRPVDRGSATPRRERCAHRRRGRQGAGRDRGHDRQGR